MNKEELLDHYRNLYQIVKREKDDIEELLEEFKLLVTVKNDIINDLHKKLKKTNKKIEILTLEIEEKESEVKIIKIR